jgi:hypothetical protein
MILKKIFKKNNIIKKCDIIIIIILLTLSFIPELIFGMVMNKSYNGTYAEITLDGELYKKIPLSEHRGEYKIKINTKYGYNVIDVIDASIGVIDADCKDKICIESGFISKPGESLVCLPHKLMIEIKSNNNENDIDVIKAH